MNEYIKSKYIRETHHNGRENGLYLFTATPLSNSLSEIYTWVRFCRQSAFDAMGVISFNDFVALFAESVTSLETKPEGFGFQLKSRLSTFNNVPELLAMYRSFTQLHTREALKLPTPTFNIVPISVESNPYQKALMRHVLFRGANIRKGKPIFRNDNMLSVTSTAKLLALSPSAVNPLLPSGNTKVHSTVQKLFEVYQETRDIKGTILVFSDIAVPHLGAGNEDKYSCYWEARDLLLNLGVKPSEIGIVHEAKTDAELDDLFARTRSGDIAFLFGSTSKLGTGTNVQDRLVATASLDVPWTPKDFEQRDGRAIRQGNQNGHVRLFRAITKNTADTFCYETVKRKKDMIDTGLADPRSADRKISEEVDLSYETLIAESTGNTIIRERMRAEADIKKLESRNKAHINQQSALSATYVNSINVVDELSPWLHKMREILQKVSDSIKETRDIHGEPFQFDEVKLLAEARISGEAPPNIAELTRLRERSRLRDNQVKILNNQGDVIEEILDRKVFTNHLVNTASLDNDLIVSVSGLPLVINLRLTNGAVVSELTKDLLIECRISPFKTEHKGLFAYRTDVSGIGKILGVILNITNSRLPNDFKINVEKYRDSKEVVDRTEPVISIFPDLPKLTQRKRELNDILKEISKIALSGDDGSTVNTDDELSPPSPDELGLLYLVHGNNLDPQDVPNSWRYDLASQVFDQPSLAKFLRSHGKISALKQYEEYFNRSPDIGVDLAGDEFEALNVERLDGLIDQNSHRTSEYIEKASAQVH